MSELTLDQLKVGSTYRGKRRRRLFGDQYDDRTLLWIGQGWDRKLWCYTDRVQYDSANVRMGRHYPKVSAEAFLKWAKEEVEEEAGC